MNFKKNYYLVFFGYGSANYVSLILTHSLNSLFPSHTRTHIHTRVRHSPSSSPSSPPHPVQTYVFIKRLLSDNIR